MKKKFFVTLFIAILLTSCGRKSDPIYNEESHNLEISNNQENIL